MKSEKGIFLTFILWILFLLVTSHYQIKHINYGDIQSRQVLIDKCDILEKTIELSIKVLNNNIMRHDAEIKMYQDKMDDMYRCMTGENNG